MRHKRFPLGPLWTNTYLVWDDSGTGFVVDPAAALDGIMDFMKREHITVEAVFLTHGHPDHIGGVPQAVELLTKKVIVSRHDAPMDESLTKGGTCYLATQDQDALLLTGDTLFAGSVGRTDLPGGDSAELERSIERLSAFPDGLMVLPGHGPESTIGEERRRNPFWPGRAGGWL